MEGGSVAGSFKVMSAATVSSVYHKTTSSLAWSPCTIELPCPCCPRGGPSDPPPRRHFSSLEPPPFDARSRLLLRLTSEPVRTIIQPNPHPPTIQHTTFYPEHHPPFSPLRRPPTASPHRGKPQPAGGSSQCLAGDQHRALVHARTLHVRPKKSPRLCDGYTAAASPPSPSPPISEP